MFAAIVFIFRLVPPTWSTIAISNGKHHSKSCNTVLSWLAPFISYHLDVSGIKPLWVCTTSHSIHYTLGIFYFCLWQILMVNCLCLTEWLYNHQGPGFALGNWFLTFKKPGSRRRSSSRTRKPRRWSEPARPSSNPGPGTRWWSGRQLENWNQKRASAF